MMSLLNNLEVVFDYQSGEVLFLNNVLGVRFTKLLNTK